MKDEKRIRYYQIRAGVFWGVSAATVILIEILLAIIFQNIHGAAKEVQDKPVETIYMEYGSIKSELENTDECYLCGNANESLMGYYRKFDTVGIIGLNEWYVLDLHLVKYDGTGNISDDQDGTSSSFGNSQGVDYNIDGTPTRGRASATVSSTNGFFNPKVVKNHLCQSCLDKVTDTLEGYFEKGKEEYMPFCLVDFKTLDIYPLQKRNRAYLVRDYWVEINHKDYEIEVDVYYLPEREF